MKSYRRNYKRKRLQKVNKPAQYFKDIEGWQSKGMQPLRDRELPVQLGPWHLAPSSRYGDARRTDNGVVSRRYDLYVNGEHRGYLVRNSGAVRNWHLESYSGDYSFENRRLRRVVRILVGRRLK